MKGDDFKRGKPNTAQRIERLQAIMSGCVGPIRTSAKLPHGLDGIAALGEAPLGRRGPFDRPAQYAHRRPRVASRATSRNNHQAALKLRAARLFGAGER